MASLTIGFGAAASRAFAAKEEKGLLDWVLGGLQKQDQFYETDPVLMKVEEKSGTAGKKSTTISVAAPKKKSGGFGGLFATAGVCFSLVFCVVSR